MDRGKIIIVTENDYHYHIYQLSLEVR
ncbi:uncharacterized protein METZ01_LOCUS54654 [marine metagenome]|uniref:Uncharacterized protein n=1 Tax=marine metagenome TaxID=408172 RepID=A0A381SCJ5_9ZZZZ